MDFVTMGDLCRELGVKRWRVEYALDAGWISRPRVLCGRRLFKAEDVEALRKALKAARRRAGRGGR